MNYADAIWLAWGFENNQLKLISSCPITMKETQFLIMNWIKKETST